MLYRNDRTLIGKTHLSGITKGGAHLDILEIIMIIFLVVAAIFVILYFVGRKLQGKVDQSQDMIAQNKMVQPVLIIDKKKMKITESNLPKQVIEQVPRFYRWRKMPLVKAKIGPKITTLICDPKVFKILPVKKMIKVELAGLYIVGLKENKNDKKREVVKQEPKWKFWKRFKKK